MSYSPRHAIARLSAATKAVIVIVASGGLLGAGAVAAISANASTNGCVSGAGKGYCGTQADGQENPQYLAVGGTVASIHAGSPIIGTRPDNVRRQLDFWFEGLHGDLIHYAPFGHKTALCISGHDSGKVNLRPCNAAYPQQSWTATLADTFNGVEYFTITNGNGRVLTMHFAGQRVTANPGPVVVAGARDEFTFAEATS